MGNKFLMRLRIANFPAVKSSGENSFYSVRIKKIAARSTIQI